MALGDARALLAAPGASPLPRARVVYLSNFDNLWLASGFQDQLARLLARSLQPGALVVSMSSLTPRRFLPAQRAPRAGDDALLAAAELELEPLGAARLLPVRKQLMDAPLLNKRGDTFSTPNLFVEVAGGWPAGLPGDDWDTAGAARRGELLCDKTWDDVVANTWLRGRLLAPYAAVRYVVEARARGAGAWALPEQARAEAAGAGDHHHHHHHHHQFSGAGAGGAAAAAAAAAAAGQHRYRGGRGAPLLKCEGQKWRKSDK
jgi:hypothetical protein